MTKRINKILWNGTEVPQEDIDIKALKEIGYDGFLTIERECGENPASDIAKATSFLREKTC